jgi:uncharacterized LabA/DUF88 family protein
MLAGRFAQIICKENTMFQRVNLFIDGSNLIGSLNKIQLDINDYSKLFSHIIKESSVRWGESFIINPNIPIQLSKTYWYVVGSIDDLDFSQSAFIDILKKQFHEDKELFRLYMKEAGAANPTKSQLEIEDIAWDSLFNDSNEWYERKKESVNNSKKFHHAVQSNYCFIDMVQCGHLKVDFIHRKVEEKGVDTSFSVDMVTLLNNYDIALLISGDADSIPSIKYLKSKGKHVGLVEFIHGSPPASKGKQTSGALKSIVDFVIPIYETDLLKDKIAEKRKFG